MNTPLRTLSAPAARRVGRAVIAISALAGLLLGCAAGGGPNWSFMPPGPTPEATEPAESPANGSPPASPDGGGDQTFDVETPPDDPLAFVPDTISAPAGATITVNYLNDSALEHNISFYEGSDRDAPNIAATERVFGPDNLQSVTFTVPEEPGDYYFQCDVHPVIMAGTLSVTP